MKVAMLEDSVVSGMALGQSEFCRARKSNKLVEKEEQCRVDGLMRKVQ